MFLRTIMAGTAALLFSGCDGDKRITGVASFAASNAFLDQLSGGFCEEVIWAKDSVLIVTARNKQIQAFDPNSGNELWKRQFEEGIEALTCSSDHVYAALDVSYPREKTESIRRLDLATGEDSTPKGIPQPLLVYALVWSSELKALCVLQHEALWVYSEDFRAVAKQVPYSGDLPIVTSDGKSVLLAERGGSCTSVDLRTGSIDHIHGPPNSGRDNVVATDAPFLSKAFHSPGGPLIRIVDNSWATGRIYFHSKPENAAIGQTPGTATRLRPFTGPPGD